MKKLSERAEWYRDYVSKMPKANLYPLHRTRGMRDCVRDWYGYCLDWQDRYELLLEATKPIGGGVRVIDNSSRASLPVNEDESFGIGYGTIERLYRYEIYLCSDGRLRYRYAQDVEDEVAKLCEIHEEEFWESVNEAFESMGYHYVESEGAWYNPETDDWGCY